MLQLRSSRWRMALSILRWRRMQTVWTQWMAADHDGWAEQSQSGAEGREQHCDSEPSGDFVADSGAFGAGSAKIHVADGGVLSAESVESHAADSGVGIHGWAEQSQSGAEEREQHCDSEPSGDFVADSGAARTSEATNAGCSVQ
jgi:hypothetical protein